MKKVLTVLLVIAVMFTFSFGSAFAVTKADYNNTLAKNYFDEVMKTVEENGSVVLGDYTVDYAVLAAHYDAVLEAMGDYVKAHDEAYVGNGTDANYEAARLAFVLNHTDNEELMMDLIAEQYAVDKAEAIAILEGLDTSDYSTAKLDEKDAHGCTTYVEHVEYLIKEAVKAINEHKFTSDSEAPAYVAAKNTIDSYFDKYAGESAAYTRLVVETGYDAGTSTHVGLGIYELNKDFVIDNTVSPAVTLENYTAAYVSGQEAVDAADVAAVKATIAKNYADYLRTSDADKDYANDVKKVLDFLADQGLQKKAPLTDPIFFNAYSVANAKKIANAITAVEKFEVDAARLAAETDVNGVLVRDAADVADLVTEGTINEYLVAIGQDAVAAEYKTIAKALSAISALYASLDDELLAFEKKVRETAVADFLADAPDDYYPLEVSELKALLDEYLAKVNAAETFDDVHKYDNDYRNSVAKVDTASEVDAKAAALYPAAKEYANFLNNQITKDYNKYYDNDKYAKLEEMINELVGNSEARTSKDIKALSEQAQALVKTLPTFAAVDVAKDAADDAVKALPKTAKIADKAVIDAAIAAVDAYEDMTAVDYPALALAPLTTAVKQYAAAFNNEMNAKVKAVDKTDKSAIEALIDEIEACADEYEDFGIVAGVTFKTNYDKLNGYLEDIQKAAATAVKKAIAAIPEKANLTEADIPVISAARAAYDAYVAEYTDYRNLYYKCDVNENTQGKTKTYLEDGFVADDFAYQTLVTAETLVGLNATTDAEKVEALKITAKSTAKKGSITVKWTVKGDASVADGFQVWKSTKHSKGYKKAFTTTKQSYKNTKGLKAGTRYYYKVRAYKVVDGKNVYSDWSNKARRVAK